MTALPTPPSPPPSPSIFRSVLAGIYAFAGTGFFGVLATTLSWITPSGRMFAFLGRLWSGGWLLAAGIRVEVERESPLDQGVGYVFMVNHQSALDIPVLLATLPVPTRFLAKRELFRIPVLGWALRAGGFIPVDRKVRSRARETIEEAGSRLEKGSSILVFPEETRSRDGNLLPFKRGGFLVAARAGASVVPVGIEGTGRAQPTKRLLLTPGTVRVRYGTPIPVGALEAEERGRGIQRVRQEIARLAGVDGGRA